MNARTGSTTVISRSKYSCDTCGKNLRFRQALIEHVRIHTGEKPLKCDYCEKWFRTKATRNFHTRRHTGYKPYKCLHCELRFFKSDARKKHVLGVHCYADCYAKQKKKPLRCSYSHCHVVYYRKSDMTKHQNRHRDGSLVVAPVQSGAGQSDRAEPNQQRIDKQVCEKTAVTETLQCPVCGKTCSRLAYLKQHIMSICRSEPKAQAVLSRLDVTISKDKRRRSRKNSLKAVQEQCNLLCTLCGKKARNWSHINEHIQNMHNLLFHCLYSDCNEVFYRQSDLNKHQNRHRHSSLVAAPVQSGAGQSDRAEPDWVKSTLITRYYQCKLTCKKLFALQQHVDKHVCEETAVTEMLQCPACGKTCSRLAHLKQHVLKSSCQSDPNVQAELLRLDVMISKKEKRRKARENSLKAVQERRDLACPSCGQRARDRTYLNEHIRIVHNNHKDYECSVCKQQFGWKRSWTRHMKMIHNQEATTPN